MIRTALRQLSGQSADGPIGVAAQSNSRNRVAISPLMAEGRRPLAAAAEGGASMCCGERIGTRGLVRFRDRTGRMLPLIVSCA